MIVSLVAVGLCLLGFEKLRAWGAVLVGEAKAKNLARAAAAEANRAAVPFGSEVSGEAS